MMRTHTTLTLRTLIIEKMDPAKYTLSAHEAGVWIETIPDITREMFEIIYFFTNSIFQKSLVSRHVCQIQRECIALLDAADKLPPLPATQGILQAKVIQCLELVLESIASNCSKYIDDDIRMPVIHLRRNVIVVKSNQQLLQILFKKLKVEAALQKVIMECMNNLINAKTCYYYRMNYVKELQEGLLRLCKESRIDRIHDELRAYLYRLNYNKAEFIRYYQQQIQAELQETEEMSKKYGLLYQYQRDFSNHPYRKPATCYDPQCRSMKEALRNFIETEIGYLRQKQETERPPVVPLQIVTPAAAAAMTYKIRTCFSVDVLAYFIKLMVNAKVIDAGVRTELLAFVAKSFQTPGISTEGISPGSLETKYKQVVQTSAKTVRAALMRMIKLLDEEFPLLV